MSAVQLMILKAVAATIILIIVIQQFLGQYDWIPSRVRDHVLPSVSHGSAYQPWHFQPERDRYNHGLSAEQCNTAFPDIFVEINRAVSQWRNRSITSESIEVVKGNDGNVRMLIHNQQLRILRTRGLGRSDFRHRILALINQIHRAITAAEANNEPVPDIEFNIIVDDIPVLKNHDDRALWSFAREVGNKRHENIWLVPDFHFWAPDFHKGGGSFQEMQLRSRARDSKVEDKIRKVAWRGVLWTNRKLRDALMRATAGKTWAEVNTMDWKNKSSVMNMDEFCQYAFLANTEGRSWSARLTHLLNCDSVPIVHDPQWHTHYNHLLEDGTNCVRVERNFSDLEAKIRYYSENIQEAQVIADHSVDTFRNRYTSPAATSCYWRKLFRGWHTVAFKPDPFDPVTDNGSEPRLKGISFDEFTVHLHKNDYPFPDE